MNRPIFTLLVFLFTCSPCYGFGFDSLSDIASGVEEATTAISDTAKVLQQDKENAKSLVGKRKTQTVDEQSLKQMKRIAIMIEGFRVYSYKPDQRSQDNFYASIKKHEARCAELAKTVPDYESSTVDIFGKPFSEHIALAKKIVAQNEEQFSKVTYDAMAVGAMKKSLKFCSKGAESIKDISYTEAYYKKISNLKYNVTRHFNSSVEIDKKVNELFEKELNVCDRNFLAPYKEYKRKYAEIKEEEKEEKAKKRAEARAQKEREAKALSEKHAKAMHDYAVSKGLSEYYIGIGNLLSNIARRSISVEQAKTYAIESTHEDKYEVQSLGAEVAYYSYFDNNFKLRQLAVKRERNGVYMEGTKLQGHYKFLTFIEARTIDGLLKQVALFESIE